MEDMEDSSSPPQSMGEGDLLSPSHHQCQSLINLVNEIAVIGDYRRTHRKDCTTLVRRIKLLMPLFEELKDTVSPPQESFSSSASSLEKALLSAKTLLQLCHDGSKLYLVLSLFNHFFVFALSDYPAWIYTSTSNKLSFGAFVSLTRPVHCAIAAFKQNHKCCWLRP